MRDNRPFTQKQDQAIRNLYEKQNIKKWSMIARLLTEEYSFPRNAKQCRDRYQQHLDPMMVSQWSPEEQQKLYHLHNEIGNKWAVIAQKFPGRTDNCVKNHFYAKLRKSLRHLNKIIKMKYKKDFKQLKIGSIYKIIEALEDRFNENTSIEQQVFNKCIRLKKQLLQYSKIQNQQITGDLVKEKQLIQQILDFSKNYKRKTKKQRRSSLNGAQLFKPASFQKRIKYSSDQQSSQSQYSFVISHKQEQSENNSQQSNGKLGIIQQDIRESMNSKYEPNIRLTFKNSYQDEQRNEIKHSQKGNVQQALKGLIQQHQFVGNKPQASFCSISLRSQSQKADMFDDNLRISEGLRRVEQMDEESPQQNIFRSQR